MKAGSLWPGTDYAYEDFHGRGRKLPLNAQCVKVLETKQEPIPGGKRKRTRVLVAFMDDEGGAITEGYLSTPRWVKAEDVFEFWEEYEEQRRPLVEERDRLEVIRLAEQARFRAEREERDAVTAVAWFIHNAGAAIRRHKEAEELKIRLEEEAKRQRRIKNVLITRGIKPEALVINNGSVIIERNEAERWLGISE